MAYRLAALLLLSIAFVRPAAAEVVDVDSEDLARLIDVGVPVVDIRTRGEWRETGVIEGSHLVTFFDETGGYDVSAWLAQLAEIAGPDDPVVVLCLSGQRSNLVTQFLDTKLDYTRVYNVRRGIGRWIEDGNPTVAP